MERTITAANAFLEENASAMNPEAWRQAQAEVAEAAIEIRQVGVRYAESLAGQLDERATEVLQTACVIRDELATVINTAASGALSADELLNGSDSDTGTWRGINAIREEDRRLARIEAELVQRIETLERVEADPLAYGDNLLSKFSNIPRPNFSF